MAYTGGDGSAGDPYQIATVADWVALTTGGTAYADWADGKYYKLTADINFAAADPLNPIGIYGNKFAGQFDGNGHTISNVTLSTTPDSYNAIALFGRLDATGKVRNLTVATATVQGSSPNADRPGYTAVLVGENTTGGLIKNCHVRGATVQASYNTTAYFLAGVIAGANHGDIEDCTAQGTVSVDPQSGTSCRAGGISGHVAGADGVGSGHITGCTANVNIANYGDIQAISYIGGITGQVQSVNTGTVTLANSNWTGTITLTSTSETLSVWVGGGVGWVSSANASSIYNNSAKGTLTITHALTGTGTSAIGGFVGTASGTGYTIDSCWSDVDITATLVPGVLGYVGGFVGFADQGTITNCYAKGSADDTTEATIAINFARFGGFAGRMNTGTYSYCWCAIDPFTIKAGNNYVKGFVGQKGTATLTGMFWDTTTCGFTTDDANATEKTTTEMQTASTFSAYTLYPAASYKWKMIHGDYPVLGWERHPFGAARHRAYTRGRYSF